MPQAYQFTRSVTPHTTKLAMQHRPRCCRQNGIKRLLQQASCPQKLSNANIARVFRAHVPPVAKRASTSWVLRGLCEKKARSDHRRVDTRCQVGRRFSFSCTRVGAKHSTVERCLRRGRCKSVRSLGSRQPASKKKRP